jgi:hypothetical protein
MFRQSHDDLRKSHMTFVDSMSAHDKRRRYPKGRRQNVYMLEVIHRGFTVRVAAMERKRFSFRYWFSLTALLSTA